MLEVAYYRTIHLADTDAAGVIYFASLLSICHEAYEEALTQAGVNFGDFFRGTAAAIPIVHGEIDYFHPIYCGDKLKIVLMSRPMSDNSFEVTYQVLAAGSPEICLAKAMTRHTCIEPETRRRLSLPPPIRQWLARD
jgi:1,4-dihydroxy-2-naphthoyl-CoA hydrolase